MCIFHNWKYIGIRTAFRWLGGVIGGIQIECQCGFKQCTKCGKTIAINENGETL